MDWSLELTPIDEYQISYPKSREDVKYTSELQIEYSDPSSNQQCRKDY